MRLGFDGGGLQVWAERERGDRLSGPTGVFEVLAHAGCEIVLLDEPITASRLAAVDVLVCTTRAHHPYGLDELTAIVDRVRAGAGLLCCSNHGPGRFDAPHNNLARFDASLAASFFVTLDATLIASSTSGALAELPVRGPLAQGLPGWPVAPGRADASVRTVTTNNGCAVRSAPWLELAVPFDLPGLVERPDRTPVRAGAAWAVTLEGPRAGSGRAVFCADSGWLGNVGSTFPGPGLFQRADNAQFLLNAVSWLGRRDSLERGP